HQRGSCVPPFHGTERRHTVGDRLDSGHGRAPGGERPEDEEDTGAGEQAPAADSRRERAGGYGVEGPADEPDQSDHEQRSDPEDEQVRRRREDPSGLLDAPEIPPGEED